MFKWTFIISGDWEEDNEEMEAFTGLFSEDEEYEYDHEAGCFCWYDEEYDAWYWLNEDTGEWLLVEDDEADWGDDEEEYEEDEEEEETA
jgi:hypothetical protein